jgi:hypothetical protein
VFGGVGMSDGGHKAVTALSRYYIDYILSQILVAGGGCKWNRMVFDVKDLSNLATDF